MAARMQTATASIATPPRNPTNAGPKAHAPLHRMGIIQPSQRPLTRAPLRSHWRDLHRHAMAGNSPLRRSMNLYNTPPHQVSGRSSGVEHNLAKVRVGRSNRLARSNLNHSYPSGFSTGSPSQAALRRLRAFCWARRSCGRLCQSPPASHLNRPRRPRHDRCHPNRGAGPCPIAPACRSTLSIHRRFSVHGLRVHAAVPPPGQIRKRHEQAHGGLHRCKNKSAHV